MPLVSKLFYSNFPCFQIGLRSHPCPHTPNPSATYLGSYDATVRLWDLRWAWEQRETLKNKKWMTNASPFPADFADLIVTSPFRS